MTASTAYQYTNSKGTSYYLHSLRQVSPKGKEIVLYYFSKSVNADRATAALPDGKVIHEQSNGFPICKNAD